MYRVQCKALRTSMQTYGPIDTTITTSNFVWEKKYTEDAWQILAKYICAAKPFSQELKSELNLIKARAKRGPSLFRWSIGRGITAIRGLQPLSTLENCLKLTKLGWSDLMEGPQGLTFRFFKLATRGLRLLSDPNAEKALRAPESKKYGHVFNIIHI